MKSFTTRTTAIVAAFSGALLVSASPVLQGCYSSTTGLTFNSTIKFNSVGSCGTACYNLGDTTFAMSNQDCYCGTEYPPLETQVDKTTCTLACPGYPNDNCGAKGFYAVYLHDSTSTAVNAPASPSDTPVANNPSSTTSANPSVVTVSGQTVVVTASSTANNSNSSGSKGTSKAGVAAGVVVGLIAVSAIGGGLFLFIRHRRRREVEEEYRRQAAIAQFVQAGKSSPDSPNYSFTDNRLDPAAMMIRRMSSGSVRDDTDYSRRILKVTNA